MKANSPSSATADWLASFAASLKRGDAAATAALFADDGYWRDLVAFTWNIVTLEGRPAIAEMLTARLAEVRPESFQAGDREGWFAFETALGRGTGHLRLKDGKATSLFTALMELKGFEEKSGPSREAGVQHGAMPNRVTWTDRRQANAAEFGYTRQPFVLVIGGGQGGIGLGARLKRLGVPALIVDSNPRPGDAWRNRYKSLSLHDPVWYDHLPYLPFPDHWPIYTPKDKMGDWLEAYVKVMELDYWSSTTCRKASWDAGRGEWTVTVEREGKPVTLTPRHIVLATGMSGFPEIPRLPGAEKFRGKQHHSSAHPGGEGWAGKRCVVVGSNNSAHDIAADLWEHGADVTMLQRSPTLVMRAETLARNRPLYSEEALASGITTDIADLTVASMPYGALPAASQPTVERIMQVSHLTEDAVVLKDGSELKAALVVYATGYGSMNQWAAQLISPEVADKVGKCWGLGSGTAKDPGPWEGELRNMWKPTAQENLWFHGGNLMQSRLYSRFLALQLKARLEGLPVEVYGQAPVHHRA